MNPDFVEGPKREYAIPNVHLAFFIHHMAYGFNQQNRETSRKRVMKYIEQESMSHIYTSLCARFRWPIDTQLLAKMQSNNRKELQKLDEAIENAKANLGEMDVKVAYFKKGEFFSRIGDSETAMENFRIAIDKPLPMGCRLTAGFLVIRMGIVSRDYLGMKIYVNQLKRLIPLIDDWAAKNRLKIYEGVYCISIRDFQTACYLFIDAITTFSAYEIMCYNLFIKDTIYLAMMCLPRRLLKEKIIDNQGVGTVLAADPHLKSYLYSLYDCLYAEFFIHLAKVEKRLTEDFLFQPHCRYYIREMRVIAYSQLLDSYSSLPIPFMAKEFGVTVDYIEEDISLLISAGRLCCQINLETNSVENTSSDYKNYQYQKIIKQGDILLNRIQKLSRIINF